MSATEARISETRVALANVGEIDPEKIDDYIDAGGFEGLKKVIASPPGVIVEELVKVLLRGRGGAGFSAGLKERFTSQAKGGQKYIVCNADEGEPGTFKDRIIMERDPFIFLEGMAIAAYAIGASRGYIYIRGEYHKAIERTEKALEGMRQKGFLGEAVGGSSFSLDLEVRLGAGSYLCGEELTLLESLEGKRGYPRIKPPFPAEKGLFGKPTLINNVETLANIPAIITKGTEWYLKMGTSGSPGTKIYTVSGDVRSPGFYEAEMSITLRELVFGLAKGMKQGQRFRAALLGGAAGTFVDESLLDVSMGFDSLQEKGATLGSGAVIVMAEGRSIKEMLLSILRFFEHESCGKCVPCRVGTRQLLVVLGKIMNGTENKKNYLRQIIEQADQMAKTSLCPLGKSPILPIRSAVEYFEVELLA